MQARRGHCELHIEMSTESCTSSDAPQDKAPALYHTGVANEYSIISIHVSGHAQTTRSDRRYLFEPDIHAWTYQRLDTDISSSLNDGMGVSGLGLPRECRLEQYVYIHVHPSKTTSS
jgi:hypothetical protein